MGRKPTKNRKNLLHRRRAFEPLEPRLLLSGRPIITEFMASNESTLEDDAFPERYDPGEFSDWIEIFNDGDAPIDLAGWHLTDRAGNLNKWQFPSVTLPVDGFLYVFASGNDVPDAGGNLHTNFSLSRDGEYLALVEPDGITIASEFGSAEADYPEQFTDVSYGYVQEVGGGGEIITLFDQLRYFQAPTPGATNLPGAKDLGPIISGGSHSPNVPSYGEDIVITTEVREGTTALNYVQLKYRVGFGGHSTATMYDNGTTGGDAVAGDGIFTATIPSAGGALPGEMIRWYTEAFDTSGHSSRWPLFQKSWDERQSEEYLGTVVADPTVTSQLPIYQLFVQNPSAADTRGGTRASIFYDGEFYDNVFIRERGNSSSWLSKTNHRINFNRDHLFRADDSGYRFQKVNLQANMADPAFLRETLEAETFRRVGVPTIRAEQVRLEMNGNFFQLAGFVEHVDGDFLERIGLDPNGALYKNPTMLNLYAVPQRGAWDSALEKITRLEIDGPDRSDLLALVTAIYEGNSDDHRARYILDNIDIPAAINYMASFHVTQEADSMHINVMVYRDSDGTGEWRWLPFDMNFSFGQWFAADFITGSQDNHFGHPFYGAEGFEPDVRNYSFSRLQDAVISTPETREMYLRRLRTLMDEYLQPPGTPVEELYFESRLAEYQAKMQQDADLDRLINGHAYGQSYWTNLPPMSFNDGIQQLITDYLQERRTHLYVTHSVDNPAYNPSLPIDKSRPAGIPHAQVGNPTINFGSLVYDPVSGNQDEEYIELFNPNADAVDISGWQLTGGVRTTFQPGTVIPAGGTLYVSPDVTAFRNRATGPTGNQRLFVQSYNGHLSNFGETITLVAADESVINSIAYEGNPSPQQSYLRITEVNYNPHDADLDLGEPDISNNEFEFIELLNTSATQTLDLTGVKFTSGVTFDFTGSGATSLGPDERVLVVRNITAFETRYGSGLNIAGEFVDSGLSNGGEPVKLEDPTNSTIAQFTYDDGNGWPGRPDGKGASLEIIDTEGGYNDEDNWRSSVAYGGTPGAAPSAGLGVVVNEVLTHTDPPLADAIELHNATGSEIDLGGWYLSDSWGWDWSTENGDYKKFRIPDGTSIPARGHITFREGHYDWESSQWVFAVDQASEFGGPGAKDFALDGAYGDDVWLMKADPSGRLTHFGDHVEFTAAANGQALGRWPDASGGIYPMTEPTLGDPNSGPALGSVVVSEVHYNPDAAQGGDDHEFIEIYNTTGQAVDLTHWRIGKAVDFEFADGTTLDGYSTMVVVPFDPGDTGKLTSFLDAYGVQSPLDIVGGYTGSLNNAGEKVQLLSPDNEETPGFFPGLLEDELFYDDAGLWPAEADGSGDSLQRLGFYRFPNDPANWIAAAPTPGEVGVVGRYVFYNNSFFDGDDPNASPADDVAIATDKRALLPGGTADFRNYTAYSRGINGVMLDIGSLPAGVTELDALVDFEFEVGNDNDVENWLAAPQPADVDLRFVAGRPPRVTITWAGEAIQNKWLRVTVKDTADTGLVAPDVFYFGNSTGEVGDAADGLVTYSDLIQTRNDINLTAAVDVDSRFDFNRDRYVDYSDLILCRNNINLTMGLNLIEVPSHEPSGPAETLQPAAAIIPEPEGATAEAPLHDAVIQQVAEESPAAAESPSADASLAELTWFYEQDQLAAGNRTSENRDQAESAVDKLLATWP